MAEDWIVDRLSDVERASRKENARLKEEIREVRTEFWRWQWRRNLMALRIAFAFILVLIWIQALLVGLIAS
jgi:flagellar biogenesis protein FliO